MLENVTTLSPQDGSKPAPNATAVTGASPRAVAASASVQRGLRHICTPCFDRIQPAANLPTKLPTIAARSWGSRKERIGADSKALVRRLDDQQSLKRQTIETRVRGTLSAADSQTPKASIEAEVAHIQEQIKALDSEVCTMDALVAQTECEVINFGESWKQANPRRMREIQTALLPEGLVYDQKTRISRSCALTRLTRRCWRNFPCSPLGCGSSRQETIANDARLLVRRLDEQRTLNTRLITAKL